MLASCGCTKVYSCPNKSIHTYCVARPFSLQPKYKKKKQLTHPFPSQPYFCLVLTIWVFPKIGVPQNGWFIMENPIKMNDLGVLPFPETPIWSYCPFNLKHFNRPYIQSSMWSYPSTDFPSSGFPLPLAKPPLMRCPLVTLEIGTNHRRHSQIHHPSSWDPTWNFHHPGIVSKPHGKKHTDSTV